MNQIIFVAIMWKLREQTNTNMVKVCQIRVYLVLKRIENEFGLIDSIHKIYGKVIEFYRRL